jgi:polyribonucleotide nucleotidyltransferase
VLPRTHGSAIFSRGETQALAIATLAPADEAQEMDTYAGGPESKRFILHYNFPPFSVGETGRFGGQNRREIGHGALAERSIAPVIPAKEVFPYAIRVSSEVMESNGSTSMASVCSGVMALMDAGVPLIRPVAGISVGLVSEFDTSDKMSRYLTMLDILGSEDHFGDMDFKLCGTSEGVTGYQLDLKLPGIPLSILEEAIVKAKRPHHHPRRHGTAIAKSSRSAPTPRASRSSRSTLTRSASSSGLAARTSRPSRPSPALKSASRTTAPCTFIPTARKASNARSK